jgi:GMC oxidoreductase
MPACMIAVASCRPLMQASASLQDQPWEAVRLGGHPVWQQQQRYLACYRTDTGADAVADCCCCCCYCIKPQQHNLSLPSPACRSQFTASHAHAHIYGHTTLLVSACTPATIGTKINWTASLRTPTHVRSEWAAPPHGLHDLGPDAAGFSASLDAVCARLGVMPRGATSGPNTALLAGLAALGVHGEVLPRNCSSAACSAYCSMGCRSGHKASADIVWLADAARAGARVLTGIQAERVLFAPNNKVCMPHQQCTLQQVHEHMSI